MLHVPKSRAEMNSHIPMSLLKPVVLADIMKIVTTDDDGSLHLHLGDDSSQNPPSDRDISCEGAFLVDVGSIRRLAWSLEPKSDTVAPPQILGLLGNLGIEEDSRLLLEGSLRLLICHDDDDGDQKRVEDVPNLNF